MDGAYAFLSLLERSGSIALGTDFPVEAVDPIQTFYAAVTRQDQHGYPEGGFLPNQLLSREQALKGMTIWAAYSNFEENEKGSIAPGKWADFIMLSDNLMEAPPETLKNIEVLQTFIGGHKVY
jgi:predicted amidohydrolase YtcJ